MGHTVSAHELSSRHLARALRYLMILPDPNHNAEKGLILFHGAQESPETILENSTIAELADTLGLTVLLPDLGNSYGLDLGPGQDYRSCLVQELIPHLKDLYPSFFSWESCAAGGISMGGYIAVSLALTLPEDFCRVFSLSGALDLKRSAQLSRICEIPPTPGLREAMARADAPLLPMAEQLTVSGLRKPEIYLAWGETDWFSEANTEFSEKVRSLGFSVKTQIRPGSHDWDYWEESLPDAVRWSAGAAE